MVGPGTVLNDRFELEEEVAAGGMARIHRAHDRQRDARVAVKVLSLGDAITRERFVREAVILASISHPGIVRYVAHGASEGVEFLAMEWLQGISLAEYLQTGSNAPTPHEASVDEDLATRTMTVAGLVPAPTQPTVLHRQLSVAQTLTMARRLVQALSQLHVMGVVHRDIKPSNLFLPGQRLDQIKLLDLGIAFAGGGGTKPDALVGTPNYMAPEQVRANAIISPATDVWAVGCVMYECLTGLRPFSGANLLEVLAKVVIAEPMPLHVVRRDLPLPIVKLVSSMLAKNPPDRPSDATVLMRRIEELHHHMAEGLQIQTLQPTTATAEIQATGLTTTERRIACILVAHVGQHVSQAEVEAVVAAGGAEAQALADGSLIVNVEATRTPTDQAILIARVALALRRLCPEISQVLITDKVAGSVATTIDSIFGQVVGRLQTVPPGRIWLDSHTEALIESRFTIDHTAGEEHDIATGAYLIEERPDEGFRAVLGRRTKFVGRRREMATLFGTFEECVEDEVSRVVLVTAAPGMGKSRLRYEFLQALRKRGEPLTTLGGHGDAHGAGSPFAIIARALRRTCGILDGEGTDLQRSKLCQRLERVMPRSDVDRLAPFLGELAGIAFPDDDNDSLRSARTDPRFRNQLMQSAWLDWMTAECNHAPVLLILEDLHWGDRPSVEFVDAALRVLEDRPFLVLALARPDVHNQFPKLWNERDVNELRLSPLSKKACAQLIYATLGSDVATSVVEAVVARTRGNAFYLEDLIRTVAEGSEGSLPHTVLGMVQARLDALGEEAKQVLRAASIFGKSFTENGVRALLGTGDSAFSVHEWLRDLAARDVIHLVGDHHALGEQHYQFRHSLVHVCVYEMLTDEDRSLGHALAGTWLERNGEQNGLVLAEHYARSDQPGQAIPWFLRAARQALEGNDLPAAIGRAERAVTAGATGERLGALRELQSVANYWLCEYGAAKDCGSEAAELLPAGSIGWFRAVGSALASSARLAESEEVEAWFQRSLETPCQAGAEAAQLVCLCRGTHPIMSNGRFELADRVLARVRTLADSANDLDALTLAQVHHVHAIRYIYANQMGRALPRIESTIAEFERAGDLRNVALERTSRALCYSFIGDFAQAEKLVRENLAFCQSLDAQQAIVFAKVTLGGTLSQQDERVVEARYLLMETMQMCNSVGNRVMEGWSCNYMCNVEHRSGNHVAEERLATRAVDLLSIAPSFEAWALAVHARALLALGRFEEALEPARRAMAWVRELGAISHHEGLVFEVLARAQHHAGAQEAALATVSDGLRRVQERADGLTDPALRRCYLAIADHKALWQLAVDWRLPVISDSAPSGA